MKTVAIVLAAGSGTRMGTSVKKQYIDLNGHELIWYSLRAFQVSSADEIVLVCSAEDMEHNQKYVVEFSKLTTVVSGGRERYNSVRMGLRAAGRCDKVLIHDGARPFVTPAIIDDCIGMLDSEDACVAAVPSKDTVKIVGSDGYVESTPDRRSVWLMQTPQCFRYVVVASAYERLAELEERNELGDLHVTDDAMVVEHFGNARVKMILADYDNIKITTPDDLSYAEWKMK